jgi:hypothetical protein
MFHKLLFALSIGCLLAHTVAAEITLDLGTARLAIDPRGYVTGMTFGGRAIPVAGVQPIMCIETDADERYPESLTLKGERLSVTFQGGSSAEWSVDRNPGFVLLRLVKLSCDRPVKRLRIMAVPTPQGASIAGTLNAAHIGEWTVAVMATSPNVHATPGPLAALPPDRAGSRPSGPSSVMSLVAQTYERHGIEPAGVAIAACPTQQWLATVERVEKAAGLPSPRPGGQWNKSSPWIRRSYLFLTDFRESQFEAALALARRGGFHMILLGQESWCKTTGHYEVNRDRFPDGVEGLRRTMDRFRAAGFKVGLHLLAASIYPPDAYLTPVPDKRLVRNAFATLAADIDEKADAVPVVAAPKDFPAEDGGYMGPGAVLQIGSELISYGARNLQDPPGFTKCQRGLLGTVPARHAKGEQVAHVLKSYGYFLYDMDTDILPEITRAFAKVANACSVDMLYFDGSEALQGDHWYYNALLHKTIYDQLTNKDVLLQASSFSNYSWHLLARSASADGHGDIKGYLDERSGVFDSFARDGMPLDIGWYYGYDPTATPDLFEYVLGTSIGYNSSISFQVSLAAAGRHPFTGEILDLISRYERLRLSGRVTPEMRQRLRIDPSLAGNLQPAEREARLEKRREYRLLDTPGGQVFQRVVYGPWREVGGVDAQSNTWKVHVPQPGTRCGVQIHAQAGPSLAAGPAYASPQAVLIDGLEDLKAYEPGGRSTLADVTQKLEPATDASREGAHYAVYTATSNRPEADGWSYVGRRFDPPLNLSTHKGIGFWMRGDGNGGAFKLQLRDEKGATDYYVQNDFTGWRYQQLARPAPDPIDYRQVRYLGFYYNGLPGKTTVSCGIDGIKALQALDARAVVNPRVELGGRIWSWTGSLQEGQSLVLWPGEPIRRYGPSLAEPETFAKADDVVLDAGDHTVTFGCAGELMLPLRIRMTLQPPEQYAVK